MKPAGLLLVLAWLVASAPLAAAQGVVASTVVVSLADPGRGLIPGAEEPIEVLVNYRVGQGAQPTPDPSDARNLSQPTRITFEVLQLPSWALGGRVEPEELRIGWRPEDTSAIGRGFPARAILWVNVSPDAPALQREPALLKAMAAPNGNIAGSEGTSSELKLRAEPLPQLNVTVDPDLVIPGGRWVSVPFTVRNAGNVEVTAKLNVTVRPENSEVRFPASVQVPYNGTVTVEVEIRTPWTYAEFGQLELEAVPLLGDTEGPTAVGVSEVRGTSATPGVPAVGVVLAAWGAARLLRRR